MPWCIKEDSWRGREESRAEWSSLLTAQFSTILGISKGCCSKKNKIGKPRRSKGSGEQEGCD